MKCLRIVDERSANPLPGRWEHRFAGGSIALQVECSAIAHSPFEFTSQNHEVNSDFQSASDNCSSEN